MPNQIPLQDAFIFQGYCNAISGMERPGFEFCDGSYGFDKGTETALLNHTKTKMPRAAGSRYQQQKLQYLT